MSEMKSILNQQHISYVGVTEKHELLQLVHTIPAVAATTSAEAADTEDEDVEETPLERSSSAAGRSIAEAELATLEARLDATAPPAPPKHEVEEAETDDEGIAIRARCKNMAPSGKPCIKHAEHPPPCVDSLCGFKSPGTGQANTCCLWIDHPGLCDFGSLERSGRKRGWSRERFGGSSDSFSPKKRKPSESQSLSPVYECKESEE